MDAPYSSGRPVLGLLGTLSDRGGANVERLRSWQDVESWMRAARIHVDDLTADDGDGVERVRALREALYNVLTARLAGVRPRDSDLGAVNAAAASALRPRLTPAADVRWTGGLDGVLGSMARDALDLLASPDLRLLRQCADPECTRLFVDRSRGGRRRWCGMRGCGDRAKAAAYRRRRRAASAAAVDTRDDRDEIDRMS